MNIVLYFWVGLLLFALFMTFRNKYTYERRIEALDAVYKYGNFLIMNELDATNIFDKTLISYERYMWSLWCWRVIDAVKPKYRDVIKPYIKDIK